MKLFDTNAWVGEWPFGLVANRDAPALWRHWKVHGIEGGLVSTFSALWVLDPMPANRILRAVIGESKTMTVLPIMNLFDPDWRSQLSEIVQWPEVRAVRLAPAYGGWLLSSRVAKDATDAIMAHGLKIVMTVRLVDERHEHPAVKVKPISPKVLAKWLKSNPECTPLLHGLTRWDVEELAKETDRFLTDFSFAEWADSLGVVGKVVGANRMVFGSLTPLLTTNAQVNKVVQSPAKTTILKAVAETNAQRFLSYDRQWE